MALRYIGKGTTDEHGVAHLTTNASGSTVNPPGYVGQGIGELDVVASVDKPIVSGSVVSEPYPVLDTILYEANEVTADKTWNATLNDCDYHVEFKICPTSRTSSFAYIQIGADTTLRIQLGHLFSNGQCGIRVMDGTTVVSSEFGVQPYPDLDTDTLITCDKIGNTYSIRIGEQSLPLVTETTVTDTKLLNAVISNDTIKEFKIWQI